MNIDNIMNDLVKYGFSFDDVSKAYDKAYDKAKAQEKEKKIADARSKVLASLTNYFIAVWGKADKDLIKEFENQLIDIEKKAGAGNIDKKAEKTDDEKLREFIEDLFGNQHNISSHRYF